MSNIMFSGDIIVYLLGLAATWGATMWRLTSLEKQVEKHNGMIERTFRLEGRMTEVEHDIRDLKEVIK